VRSEGAEHLLSWSQLRGLAAQQVDRTLICDGAGFEIRSIHAFKNTFEHWDWQFGAIGNASWDVISLDRLFDALKLPLRGPYVRAVAADGQDWFYPIETVRRGEILVAVGMNGSPLSHKHGAPARLIASGQYGRASLKWIVELTAGAEAYSSRAYEGGPSHVTQVKPVAFAASPAKNSEVGRRVKLSGAAYAGAVPIQEVIITNQELRQRTRARLVDPARPFVWSRWEAEVELARGAQILSVACADRLGRHSRQRSPRVPQEPDGWDGLHHLRLVGS
jgi:DMSO/TMAO reductase YedYZ molybdopterin-dependent catalytic subunit